MSYDSLSNKTSPWGMCPKLRWYETEVADPTVISIIPTPEYLLDRPRPSEEEVTEANLTKKEEDAKQAYLIAAYPKSIEHTNGFVERIWRCLYMDLCWNAWACANSGPYKLNLKKGTRPIKQVTRKFLPYEVQIKEETRKCWMSIYQVHSTFQLVGRCGYVESIMTKFNSIWI